MTDYIESHPLDGLELDHGVLMVTIRRAPVNSGILNRCLADFAAASINVDVITQTAPVKNAIDASFIVDQASLPQVVEMINRLGDEYPELKLGINKDITAISISGIGMRSQPGVAAKFFRVLADHQIEIMMITTSEIRTTCIIRSSEAERACAAVNAAFDFD